jgi:hypothetical protein
LGLLAYLPFKHNTSFPSGQTAKFSDYHQRFI